MASMDSLEGQLRSAPFRILFGTSRVYGSLWNCHAEWNRGTRPADRDTMIPGTFGPTPTPKECAPECSIIPPHAKRIQAPPIMRSSSVPFRQATSSVRSLSPTGGRVSSNEPATITHPPDPILPPVRSDTGIAVHQGFVEAALPARPTVRIQSIELRGNDLGAAEFGTFGLPRPGVHRERRRPSRCARTRRRGNGWATAAMERVIRIRRGERRLDEGSDRPLRASPWRLPGERRAHPPLRLHRLLATPATIHDRSRLHAADVAAFDTQLSPVYPCRTTSASDSRSETPASFRDSVKKDTPEPRVRNANHFGTLVAGENPRIPRIRSRASSGKRARHDRDALNAPLERIAPGDGARGLENVLFRPHVPPIRTTANPPRSREEPRRHGCQAARARGARPARFAAFAFQHCPRAAASLCEATPGAVRSRAPEGGHLGRRQSAAARRARTTCSLPQDTQPGRRSTCRSRVWRRAMRPVPWGSRRRRCSRTWRRRSRFRLPSS